MTENNEEITEVAALHEALADAQAEVDFLREQRDLWADDCKRAWAERERVAAIAAVDREERDAEIARLTEAIQAAVGFLEYPASRDLFGMRRGWAADCLRAALRQEGTGR